MVKRDWDAIVEDVKRSPRTDGVVRLIVARPRDLERQALDIGHFDVREGLRGDNWAERGSKRTDDGSAHPDMQVAVTNARWMQGLAGPEASWPPAGDQLYLDLDLSRQNLQAGDAVHIGAATFVVTDVPHNGCKRFAERYGADAVERMSTPDGKDLRLRGIYFRTVTSGEVRVGDRVVVERHAPVTAPAG